MSIELKVAYSAATRYAVKKKSTDTKPRFSQATSVPPCNIDLYSVPLLRVAVLCSCLEIKVFELTGNRSGTEMPGSLDLVITLDSGKYSLKDILKIATNLGWHPSGLLITLN